MASDGRVIIDITLEDKQAKKQVKNINKLLSTVGQDMGKDMTDSYEKNTEDISKMTDKMAKNVNKSADSIKKGLKDIPNNIEITAEMDDKVTDQSSKVKESIEEIPDKVETTATLKDKASSDLDELKNEAKDVPDKVDIVATLKDKASGNLEGLGDKIAEITQSGTEAFDSMSQDGIKALLGIGMKAGPVGIAVGAIGAAAVGVAYEFGQMKLQVEKSTGEVRAQLGLTRDEAEKFTKSAKSVYKDGWGESLSDTNEAIIIVKQNLQDLVKDSQLAQLAKDAEILKQVFGYDIAESTRSVKTLMTEFGITGQHAFDLITKASQKGVNFSDELLDTIDEYSVQFSQMGMTADDMFNILIQGTKNGSFNLDKMADSFKEFTIRAVDGSKTTQQGFKDIGLNADDMAKKFAAGGDSAKQAFKATIIALNGVKDPVKQNIAGVNLFGTQWEDVKKKAILSMDTTKNQLGQVDGATKKAGNALQNNFAAKWEKFWRSAKVSTTDYFGHFMEESNKGHTLLGIVTEDGINSITSLINKNAEAANDSTIFGDKVSAGTAKAVNGYMKLNDKATEQLMLLKANGDKVSKDTASSLVNTFTNMGSQIQNALSSKYTSSYNTLATFLANSKTLSQKEQQEILNNVSQKQTEQKNAISSRQQEIVNILNTASKQKRSLSKSEQQTINADMEYMQTKAVETMSKGEVEQNAIMARLTATNEAHSAKQAAAVIRNSLKAKNHAISDANSKYKQTVNAIIRERDETHSISADEANKLIKEAKKQRDEAVSKAKDKHNKVVSEVKKENSSVGKYVDLETGHVLSKTEKMKKGALDDWGNFWSGVKGFWNKILSLFGEKTSSKKSTKQVSKASSASSNAFKIAGYGSTTYATGTPKSGHPGGDMILGDGGMPELWYTPQGKMGLSPAVPTLYKNAPKGTQVLSGPETEKVLGKKLYADGTGGFWSGIASILGKGYEWVKGGVNSIFNTVSKQVGLFESTLPQGDLSKISKLAWSDTKSLLTSFVKEKANSFLDSFSISGDGYEVAAKAIRAAMALTGHSGEEDIFTNMMKLAKRESGYNSKAINLWDSNAKAGHPSMGMFQMIQSSFDSYKIKGHNNIWNPVDEGAAAIRYIIARYGRKNGFVRAAARAYKNGGKITQPTLALMGETGDDEYVVNPKKKTALPLLTNAIQDVMKYQNIPHYAEGTINAAQSLVANAGSPRVIFPQAVLTSNSGKSVESSKFDQMKVNVDIKPQPIYVQVEGKTIQKVVNDLNNKDTQIRNFFKGVNNV